MDGGHAGDMTNLYVNGNGTGQMTFMLDRFAVADLLDAGGRLSHRARGCRQFPEYS